MKTLIVDDEQHGRAAIRLLVDWQAHGITKVLEAEDGEYAIQLIREEAPQIVITDMRMPGYDGTRLMDWLQAHAPQTKVIVVSGHDDFPLVRHTIRCGGTDYILKPVEQDEINEALTKAVAAWRAAAPPQTTMPENHIIRDIAAYLDVHFAEEITLQHIASKFYLSREYISRKFKQEFGVNLSEYLSRLRIRQAKLLLLIPRLRLQQIAEMVGYQDENYFGKVFKKLEGITPSEYRKTKTEHTPLPQSLYN